MDHKMDSNIMLVENIKQKLDEGDKLIDRLVDYKLTEQRMEMEDHMKREYNLIMFGAPESMKDDPMERKEDDNNYVLCVLHELNVRPADYDFFTRLGMRRHEGSNPRP